MGAMLAFCTGTGTGTDTCRHPHPLLILAHPSLPSIFHDSFYYDSSLSFLLSSILIQIKFSALDWRNHFSSFLILRFSFDAVDSNGACQLGYSQGIRMVIKGWTDRHLLRFAYLC
jgi:hypothetical protein